MHWSKRIGLGMAAATAIGGAVMGGVALQTSAAVAGDRDTAAQARAAAKQAKLAERALKSSRHDEAIGRAEQAVLLVSDDASYRALLGRTYLGAGRFASAAQAFEDALKLDGQDARSALNLALAKIALGDWQSARRLIEQHGAQFQPADRGLAIALAGDPMGAIAVLGAAAREQSATAKVRQNLALSLALAGKWQEAHTIAAIDLSPAEAQQRIMQWAQFARPAKASDQVASLLGVTAVEDGGMPVQLALRDRSEAVAVAAAPTPIEAYAPAISPEAAAAAAIPVVATAAVPRTAGIVFAERREIVQSIPASAIQPVRMAARPTAVGSTARTPARGNYFVQLGAFENAGVARDAWGRISRRVPALTSQTPRGMAATVGSANYYRLSVGGYTRSDAVNLCSSVRAKGGRCFVRSAVGEQVAGWARGPMMASR